MPAKINKTNTTSKNTMDTKQKKTTEKSVKKNEIPKVKEEVKAETNQNEIQSETTEVTEKKKREIPTSFSKRAEIQKYIVEQEQYKGFWSPVTRLISWIINEHITTEADNIKKLDLAKEYYDTHRKECSAKFKEFKEEYENKKNEIKKNKVVYEPGKYLLFFLKDDSYHVHCVKDNAIDRIIKKKEEEDFNFVEKYKVSDDFDIKTLRENDKIQMTKNIIVMKDNYKFEDFIKDLKL
jgi:hypothetical protein